MKGYKLQRWLRLVNSGNLVRYRGGGRFATQKIVDNNLHPLRLCGPHQGRRGHGSIWNSQLPVQPFDRLREVDSPGRAEEADEHSSDGEFLCKLHLTIEDLR